MNPYEKTADEMRRQSQTPERFAKKAIGLGSTVLGASAFIPILARAAPFLSQYIPENLAIKGLSKIHPKLGKFVDEALNSGYDFKEVKDFIGDQIKQSEPPKENRNIIEQYSPELHQFIDQQIRGGRKPIEAAAIAQNDKRFSSIINKLSKDHNTPWSSIIESVYGIGDRAEASNPRQEALNKWNERKKKQSFLEEERERFERGYGNVAQQQGQPNPNNIQQTQPAGQPGPGQQALMEILNKINQRLGQ